MKILQTPEENFKELKDFSYQPKFVDIEGINVHYISEGKGPIILCLHGEPTWSYLYRKFIPILENDFNIICPDFIGFGKSDKYDNPCYYSYTLHYKTLKKFIQKLSLKDIHLVVHDWGGLIGLGFLGENPDLFQSVTIMNTFLPTGKKPLPFMFKIWQYFARYYPGLPIDIIMQAGTYTKISKETLKAYKAPFHNKKLKSGAIAWPQLVPSKPWHDGVMEMERGWDILSRWQKPAMVIFSDKDFIFKGQEKLFSNLIPHIKETHIIKNAGHFLQEDKGEEIAHKIFFFLKENFN